MKETAEKSNARSVGSFCFLASTLFVATVFFWPALNAIVSELVQESPKEGFIANYEFFLNLSWPFSGLVCLTLTGILAMTVNWKS